jgi:DNA-binding NarL/FixJ family response regulator
MRVMALKPAGYLLKNISQEQLLSSIDKYFVKEQYNKL